MNTTRLPENLDRLAELIRERDEWKAEALRLDDVNDKLEPQVAALRTALGTAVEALERIKGRGVVGQRCLSCGMEWGGGLLPEEAEFHTDYCPAQIAQSALAAARAVGATATMGRIP